MLIIGSYRVCGHHPSRLLFSGAANTQDTQNITRREALEIGPCRSLLPNIRFCMPIASLAMGRHQLPVVGFACLGLPAGIWIACFCFPRDTNMEKRQVTIHHMNRSMRTHAKNAFSELVYLSSSSGNVLSPPAAPSSSSSP